MLINIPLVDSVGNNVVLEGYLTIPDDSKDRTTSNTKRNSLVIFVHGSGSSKDSSRNQSLSQLLNKNGIATFLFDLLTKEEEESDNKVEKILQKQVPGLTLNKFNISLLVERLIKVTNYLLQIAELKRGETSLNIGYFGASTGVAAALYASGKISEPTAIKTIVSRGGRPNLISSLISDYNNKDIIGKIKYLPFLFIIGQKDKLVLDWTKNFIKNKKLVKNSKIEIIKDASHLFEEEGKLEKVGDIAENWFIQHLQMQ